MKVLQVTTNYPTISNPIFGIFMKEQVESLEQFGVENTIFFSDGSSVKKDKRHGAKWIHFRSSIKLLFHVLTHKYDLIHCHSSISGLIMLCSGAFLFKKCIISFQNDPEKELDGRLFKKLYRIFNVVIVKKHSIYDSWKKVKYLPNGCNTEFFKPLNKIDCKNKLNLDLNKRYTLFVDSNSAKKRTQKRKDRFDETLSILRNKYSYNNIETLSMISVKREEVPLYFNACELHLLTSDLEGSPNSVKESIACNIPVVTTDVGNVSDVLENVPNCFVCKSFKSEELADNVHKVLSRNKDNEFLIRDAFIDKKLDINSVALELFNIYKSLK